MPFTATTDLVGVKETIRSLNKIEPGLRKQFVADVRQIGQPAVREVQRQYDRVPLSGMNRKWSQNGRRLFPFTVAKAQKGVQVQVNSDRFATAIISIIQRDPGTAIFETAGRKSPNALGQALGPVRPGRTRIIGPAVYRARPYFEKEMRRSILAAMRRVQKELG